MQVPSEYHGREQSYLKHLVLKEYLGQWAHKLGSTARQSGSTHLWYVDAFAGPWKQRHAQLRDTSFAIGLEALEAAAATWHGRGYPVELSAVCVEKDPEAYAELDAFLTNRSGRVTARAIRGKFGDHANEVAAMLGRDPAFVFVDPLGWKDAAMKYIAPLAEKGPRDVMVNVMFDHLNRQKDRDVDSLRQQMRDFFGLGDSDLPAGLDEDDLFRLYRSQLKEKCGLGFAADLIVPHPTIARTKFHLVVGGKNKAVVEVFREVERRVIGNAAAAIRDEAIQRAVEASTGQLSLLSAPPSTDPGYDALHGRDARGAVEEVKSLLAERGPMRFENVWPEVLQDRHLTVSDLRAVVWKMHEAGVVRVQNLGKRERSIKDEHVLALG